MDAAAAVLTDRRVAPPEATGSLSIHNLICSPQTSGALRR
jgi:hypothetical protein